MDNQCSFIKKDLTRCKAFVVAGSLYCLSHDIEMKEVKHEAVQKGGQADSYKKLDLKLPPFEITQPQDVTKAVVQTINELRDGKLPPRVANTIGYLLGIVIKAFEVAELDDKIEAIDRIILERKTRK